MPKAVKIVIRKYYKNEFLYIMVALKIKIIRVYLPASVQTFLRSAPLKSSDNFTTASQSEIRIK